MSAALVAAVEAAAQRVGARVARGLTYACVEGPRLGTQAESHLLRQLGCHMVGMTNVPEVLLAREAQVAYATVGSVTDCDSRRKDPTQHVSLRAILERYGQALFLARQVFDGVLRRPPRATPRRTPALSHAVRRRRSRRRRCRARVHRLRRTRPRTRTVTLTIASRAVTRAGGRSGLAASAAVLNLR